MSYNNQFSYSPYFHGANQNGRDQVAYPNTSTEGGSYQRQSPSYPEPQSYPSPQTSSESAPNAYASSKYGYLRPPNTGDYDNTKAKNQVVGMNTYQNARKPIDTTALGNLAYASSLGQNSPDHSVTGLDNSSLQQVSDYNHSQTTANYSEPSPYSLNATAPATNRYEFPRPDNYEAGNRRESIESRDSPSMNQAHYASYSADGGQKDQEDQVYSRLPQVHPNYPSRPSSGQSIRTVQRSNPHSTPTSVSSNIPSYTTTSAKRVNNHVYESDPSMTSQPQASNPANRVTTSARARSSISQSKDEVHQNVSKQSIMRTSSASDRQTNHQTNNQEIQSRNDKNSTIGSRDDERNDTGQANKQHPVTVDPNQIFNHQEYQRRQATTTAATTRRTDQVLERKTDATKASASVGDASTKEQMELEMKQMIDKMREYKAKDPNLFLHIWEQVKKVSTYFQMLYLNYCLNCSGSTCKSGFTSTPTLRRPIYGDSCART